MKTLLFAYTGALLSFLILDALWITLAAKPMYEQALRSLMRAQPIIVPTVLFYCMYCAGIVFFAIRPSFGQDGLASTAMYGALLGLLAYGTFAATNYAILTAWTPKLALADTLWGGVVTACAAAAGHWAGNHFG
ncbi:MAG: DUF2177 family protein [Pseudomonadota bacterium]